MQKKHVFQLITVMLLWSICYPLITTGISYAPHLTFASLRALIAGVLLLVPAIFLKRPQPKDLKTWGLLSAIGLGATTLGFFGMFHAAEFVSPGVATVLTNMQPLMAAVLASLYLKEHLDVFGKLGIVLGFSGIVVIALPGLWNGPGGNSGAGVFYILLAAIGITVSNVLIRSLGDRVDTLSAMGWQLIFGSMFLSILAMLTEDIYAINWSWPFLLSLIGLALPGTAWAYWLWCHVLKEIELNQANSFSFLVPILGVLIGVTFYEESINLLVGSGIVLTILGIAIVNWPRPKIINKT